MLNLGVSLLSVCILLFSSALWGNQQAKAAPPAIFKEIPASQGQLLIIGGGPIPDTVIKTFITLAGGPQAKIVIFPHASEIPTQAAETHRKQFQTLGAKHVEIYGCKRGAMDQPACLKQFEKAGGLFFTGGDQNKLAAAFQKTKAFQKVLAQHQTGGVIGGTSAGAAIMSKVMITGEERPVSGEAKTLPVTTIRKNRVLTAMGFGLVDRYIIDQHFILRQRQNRLLSVVLDHPALIGVGIDESTGIVVHPNQDFEVVGKGAVMVFDARKATGIVGDPRKTYTARDIRLHLLTAGQRFE